MHLDVANRDEILYERIQSMEAKVNDEVSKQTKDIMRTIETEKEDRRVKHEELIEHIQQTEHSIRTKTDEKTENILTKVEESRQDIDDKILNLGEDFKEAISSEAGKLGKIGIFNILKYISCKFSKRDLMLTKFRYLKFFVVYFVLEITLSKIRFG